MRVHDNNFGFLRLGFALLVIVGHSFELNIGKLAVDGFFIISGYLVAQSFDKAESVSSYLKKRVLRIYPGFCVSFLICALVIAPLVKLELSSLDGTYFLRIMANMLALSADALPSVFDGQRYPFLNGSMWTVPYEFRCYLAVSLFGVLAGVFRVNRPWLLAIMAALLIAISFPIGTRTLSRHASLVFGDPLFTLRYLTMFCSGAVFYVFRDRIQFSNGRAMGAAFVLSALFFSPVGDQAIAMVGAYLIFWFGLKDTPRLSRINNTTDISYGTYLYAYPIQQLVTWYELSTNSGIIFAVSALGAMLLGFVSWRLVEAPCLRLKSVRLMRVPRGTATVYRSIATASSCAYERPGAEAADIRRHGRSNVFGRATGH